MADGGHLGITPPISTALPTEAEKRCNDALQKELKAQGTYEQASETEKRRNVLKSLQTIADAFVQKVASIRCTENVAIRKGARGQIFTYGSYRLGVYGPGSDIDTLVVGPKYVLREDFFDYFPDLLYAMAPADQIQNLTTVRDAFVPIIKFEYSDISIDLIFTRIDITELPSENNFTIQDNNILRGLDEAELRSLNGTRVTDQILTLVPEQTSFRLALRAIKLWAQRRAIYANIMGYPGGVAWAMMVARIAQLYPRANGATLFNKFFQIMKQWPWPSPVLLKEIETGNLQVRVWNPAQHKPDSWHLMPIITPAYPSMCATHNVSASGKTIILRELERFSKVADAASAGKVPWKDLFVKHTFFTQDYKYYIMVISSSTVKEHSKIWSGFIESKVRFLVQGLERHDSISLARPFNKGYERCHLCKTGTDQMQKVADGSLAFQVAKDALPVETEQKKKTEEGDVAANDSGVADTDGGVKSEDKDEKGEDTAMYTTTHYIGLELYEGAKSLDLSYQVNNFKDTCHEWEKYKTELRDSCRLSIQHLRNVDLPADVFDAGEVKPTRPLKKKRPAPANGAAPNGKRTAMVAATDENPAKRRKDVVGAAGAG